MLVKSARESKAERAIGIENYDPSGFDFGLLYYSKCSGSHLLNLAQFFFSPHELKSRPMSEVTCMMLLSILGTALRPEVYYRCLHAFFKLLACLRAIRGRKG